MTELEQWVQEHNIECEILGDGALLKISDKKFITLQPDEFGNIFDENLNLKVSKDMAQYASKANADYFLYKFGGLWYYTPIGGEGLFNPFIYYGQASGELAYGGYAPLGVHGNFELLNGNRSYDVWAKKAKFLKYKALGLCERNTLAGTIPFQKACKAEGLQPIIGETVMVSFQNNIHEIKLYALSEKGWRNLLRVNKMVNIGNVDSGVIDLSLINSFEGLAAVIKPDENLNGRFIDAITRRFDEQNCYVQIDPVEYSADEEDTKHLLAIKNYIDNYLKIIPPILLNDMYYLESYDSHIKKKLNAISGRKHGLEAEDESFKDLDTLMDQVAMLFTDSDKDSERMISLITRSLEGAETLVNSCNFEIEFGKIRMPKFTIPEGYKEETSEDLFLNIIGEGVDRLVEEGKYTETELLERIEQETDLIFRGGFVDYFMILWDICKWCKENDILVGVGRGSAGGSLVAYLLGITMINPLDYDLLFERFLNESRIETELPDIDVDFEGLRRDEVKRYMEKRYGAKSVCSIGTYGTFQIKAAIKDLARQKGVDFATVNYITSKLKMENSGSWEELFKISVEDPKLKSFIIENSDIINDARLILNQPKNQSIHACATLITPNEIDGEPADIFDWIPLRETADGVLVSEWEGEDVASAGFLKEDILGIKQLDKFRAIIDLIKDETGEVIELDKIPLDQPEVYELFKKGLNEDVFHFGSKGLKTYSREVKPDHLDDLIAMNALYRPGAMGTQSHLQYVKIKHGEEEPEFDYGLEEVTVDTYGLYIFQEQIMKAVQVLGGFSLTEADQVRKAMGKKKMALIKKYKARFIEGAQENGCHTTVANNIWGKLEAFAKYGFNKSHAAAYSITGYIAQYLKWKYPLHFWAVAFTFGEDKKISGYVAEVNNTDNGVSIVPPDINTSHDDFNIDFDTNEIYWSLSGIKQVGEVALKTIMDSREAKGSFFSVKEFVTRVEKSKVNKRHITNLILAGCFDKMYNIKLAKRRIKILKEYYKLIGQELPAEFIGGDSQHNYFWMLKQMHVSGLSHFDYREIIGLSDLSGSIDSYIDSAEMRIESSVDRKGVVAGVLTKIVLKKGKKGEYAKLVLESNDEELDISMFYKPWAKHKDKLMEQIGKIVVAEGKVYYDEWHKKNQFMIGGVSKICVL